MTLTLMDIIKVDQLSFAARAGALDGSLAYAMVYEQHRELVTQTALSGLRGLEQILSETGIYGTAMRSLQEASGKIEEANIEAQKDPFQSASGNLRDQHRNAMINGFRTQGGQYSARASYLDNRAQELIDSTIASNPERTLANDLQWASSELYRLGVGYLVNQGDPAASLHHATLARDAASTVQTKAQALMQTLSAITPFPSARYNKVDEIYKAAGEVIEHANSIIQFDTQSPIARIRNETPTTHDLGGGYSLSTWGNSGYWTLTDANGEGILVHPNGNVDNLKGGAGWKFDTTSTFVLPNQTKITVNPGSSTNLLISRGIHAFTLGNLNGGASPSTSSYTELNGRDADRASNDGHILELNGNGGAWRNGGNVLGDTGGREVIGTVAISNELRLDPTDVTISAELKSFLTELGITDYDYDGDGKLNNTELMNVATHTATYIKQMQDAYEEALQRLAKANAVLNELNELMDRLRKETDRAADSRGQDSVNAKSELQSIEQRLIAALQSLQGTEASIPVQGNIETSASKVLEQLTSVTQNGRVTPPPAIPGTLSQPDVTPAPTGLGSAPGTVSTQPQIPTSTSPMTDPIGDSLRRAGRLLSGIRGGGHLNSLELPPKPGSTQEAEPVLSSESSAPPVTDGTTGEVLVPTNVDAATPPAVSEPSNIVLQIPNNESVENPVASPIGESTSGDPLAPLTAQVPAPTVAPEVPASTISELTEFLTKLSALDSPLPAVVTPQNLSAGLDALLGALTQLGILPPPIAGDTAPAPQASIQVLAQLFGQPPSAPTTLPQESSIPGSESNLVSLVQQAPPDHSPQTPPSNSLHLFFELLAQLGAALRRPDPDAAFTAVSPQPQFKASPQTPVFPIIVSPPASTTPSTLPASVQQLLELLTGKPAASLPGLSTLAAQITDILSAPAKPLSPPTTPIIEPTASLAITPQDTTPPSVPPETNFQLGHIESAPPKSQPDFSAISLPTSLPKQAVDEPNQPGNMVERLLQVLQELAATGSVNGRQNTGESESIPVIPTSPGIGGQPVINPPPPQSQPTQPEVQPNPNSIGFAISIQAPIFTTPISTTESAPSALKIEPSINQQSPDSPRPVTSNPESLSRIAEPLLRVLQGLMALGSTDPGQNTSNANTQISSATELRLGLQSFLAAFGAPPAATHKTGTPSQAPAPDTPPITVSEVAPAPQSNFTQAVNVIAGNFQTDPELMKILQENLSQALQNQQRQLSQATTLFTQSQEIVQKFVTLIKEDDLVRDVVKSDDLSDEQQAIFDTRMTELRKDWGLEWGSDDNRTPASQSNLVSRAMQSGMMV